LATILNTVQAAVLIVDAEADEVQYANPAALALLGATETEVVGCSSRRFFWARPRDGGAADEPGQPLERSETTVRRANGEECTVLRTVTPTTLGGRDCLVIAFLDMTELKRAEDAQRLATVGQLAAGVAHEFNNILAILGGRAQLAEALGTDEEHGKLVDAVLRGTQRGAAICAELTRFSKPQAPRRERIRLEDPLEAALGIAERHVSAAAVDVSRHYDAGGRTAYADPGQLEQVFLNLIINACHAMPGGGTLSLAVTPAPGEEAHDDGLLVTVADTGTGISPEHIQRVFEPFFTTKGRLGGSDVPGTGLGLSVSHGIVVAHGGRITARSEVGVGTTFEVWLPATTAEPSATLAETGASIGPPAEAPSGLRILVADDEEDIRGMLVDLLSGQGHSVTSVADAQQATAALNEATFDAVLTDLLMPGGGGRRVLEVAQHLPVAPPVLVLTGRGEVEVAEEMLGLGATACLRKPLDLGEVLAALGGADRA